MNFQDVLKQNHMKQTCLYAVEQKYIYSLYMIFLLLKIFSHFHFLRYFLIGITYVRFNANPAVLLKIQAFWDVMHCQWVQTVHLE